MLATQGATRSFLGPEHYQEPLFHSMRMSMIQGLLSSAFACQACITHMNQTRSQDLRILDLCLIRLLHNVLHTVHCLTFTIRPGKYNLAVQGFTECSSEQLQNIVQTNLVGSLLCARNAWRVMKRQPSGGHIFNIDGAGADGSPTPQYAAYGATKAGGLKISHNTCLYHDGHAQYLLH